MWWDHRIRYQSLICDIGFRIDTATSQQSASVPSD